MPTELSYVQPGDLITAEFINQIVDAITAASVDATQFYDQIATLIGAVGDLETRVAALEQALGSPPKGKDTKETKESKESKESKEIKDTKESKEVLQDKIRIKETIADKIADRKVTVEKSVAIDSIRQASPEKLADQARSLVADRQPVQHFISTALRPDLSRSALSAEEYPDG
jgi:hypothetical protein